MELSKDERFDLLRKLQDNGQVRPYELFINDYDDDKLQEGLGSLEEWGWILSDLTEKAPALKRKLIELPFKSGAIDLTQAIDGQKAYTDHIHEYELTYYPVKHWTISPADTSPRDYAEMAIRMYNSIAGLWGHSKELKVRPSWDIDRLYKGRFEFSDLTRQSAYVFKCKIKACYNAFKTVSASNITVNARGGVMIPIKTGASPVTPTITTASAGYASYKDKTYPLAIGVNVIEDLVIDADPYGDEKLFVVVNGGDASHLVNIKSPVWKVYAGRTWFDRFYNSRWIDLVDGTRIDIPDNPEDMVTISYERQEL